MCFQADDCCRCCYGSFDCRERAEVLPDDIHNRKLVDNVHPGDWTNPEPSGRYNLVVIGAGRAGLVVAAGAAGKPCFP